MSLNTKCYAAHSATTPMEPWSLERREPGESDVLIEILFCGVCHSDLHFVRNEWGGSIYPLVPGHEIVGRVTKVGSGVTKYKIGDIVGVGCLVDSCGSCPSCKGNEEQFCENGATFTYNSKGRDGKITYGGYSTQIVVTENFVVRMPENLDLAASAPLLCAGITTYSPLKRFGVNASHKVGIVGLGGLGHMGVKFAKAFGAHVTVISHSENKQSDAERLGADDFLCTKKESAFANNQKRFDFLLDTVSATHDLNAYLSMLKNNGSMVMVGIPDPMPLAPYALVGARRSISGSLIGGIAETQEMLDFCGANGIVCDIEMINMQQINEAYDRMMKSDVRYRFVIDMASLKEG